MQWIPRLLLADRPLLLLLAPLLDPVSVVIGCALYHYRPLRSEERAHGETRRIQAAGAEEGYQDLLKGVDRKPFPSLDGLRNVQRMLKIRTPKIGEIKAEDGTVYWFHCTRIADGTRTIAPNTDVYFEVVPSHRGRWEATAITHVPEPA